MFFFFLEKTLTKYRNCLLILLLVCDNLMRLLTCIFAFFFYQTSSSSFLFLYCWLFFRGFSYTTFFLLFHINVCLLFFLFHYLQFFYPKCVCVCWCICMYNGIIERKIIKDLIKKKIFVQSWKQWKQQK